MKATGIVRRIDDLGRIVIPKEIRRTLRIKEGDPLEIFTDRQGEVIFKKYSPISELQSFAAEYAETLQRTSSMPVFICDRDEIIAVSGASHTISVNTADGRGFTAIIVAWLSKFNAVVMVLFSFLLVFLDKGAVEIASKYQLNEYASEIIESIILFFILGSEFFINYRLVFRRSNKKAEKEVA